MRERNNRFRNRMSRIGKMRIKLILRRRNLLKTQLKPINPLMLKLSLQINKPLKTSIRSSSTTKTPNPPHPPTHHKNHPPNPSSPSKCSKAPHLRAKTTNNGAYYPNPTLPYRLVQQWRLISNFTIRMAVGLISSC